MASLDEETTKKVIRQVEFYFSDSNLPRDKFLTQTVSESEDGMISLALICSFSRMRGHLNLGDAKPEDVPEDILKAVAETLRSSETLKISEDGKKIGRSTELLKPEEVIEQLDVRTIAASPLEYDVKLEDVESFFNQHAKVTSVRLPRHVADKRLFCGTALVEFSTEEDAEKILKQSLAYAGVEMELKPKKDYDVERAKKVTEVEASRAQGVNRNNRATVEPSYPKGLLVAFKLKSLLAECSVEHKDNITPTTDNVDACKTNGEQDTSKSASEDADQKMSEDVKDNGGEQSVEKEEIEGKVDDKTTSESEEKEVEGEKVNGDSIKKDEHKSVVVTYKDNKDVVLREDLKSVFQKFGTVKFVDFKLGEESGYIRFEEAEAAQKARAAAVLAEEGGLVVKNYVATLDPLTGEAEKEYWSLLRGNQDRHKDHHKGNWGRGGGKNHRGGGGGGGRHNGKHFRSRDNDSSGRPNKAQKV